MHWNACEDMWSLQRELKWTEIYLLISAIGWDAEKLSMFLSFSPFVWKCIQKGNCYYVDCHRFLCFRCSPISFPSAFYKAPFPGLFVLHHLQLLAVWLLIKKLPQYREARHLGAISRLWAETVECWIFCMPDLANGWRKIKPLFTTALLLFPTRARPIWFL